jgi:hypothetical protein
MGYTSYSSLERGVRAENMGFTTKSTYEIFKQRSINNAMNPHGIVVRESRDSVEHPNVVPIIMNLDVTGSMGTVPHYLVKEGLPHMMQSLIDGGIKDPQVLFTGIGDHECDDSPLQVGQFESGDELLDKWLTDVYLEGGGGSNEGESYLLAWYFAGYHTVIDSFEKRGQKGFLFTIGDEPTLKRLPKREVEKIMGPGQYSDFTAPQLLDKASEKYHCYHLHIKQTNAGSRQETMDNWKQIMGDHLIIVDRKEDVARIIAETVIKHQTGSAINIPMDIAQPSTVIEEKPIILL